MNLDDLGTMGIMFLSRAVRGSLGNGWQDITVGNVEGPELTVSEFSLGTAFSIVPLRKELLSSPCQQNRKSAAS